MLWPRLRKATFFKEDMGYLTLVCTMSKNIKWPIQMIQQVSSAHGKVGSNTKINIGHLHDGIINFYYYVDDQNPFHFSFLT